LNSKLITLLFIIFTVIFLRQFPQFIERYYSDSIFLVIAGSLQSISSVLRFPLFFLVLAIILYYLLNPQFYKKPGTMVHIISWCSYIIAFFSLSWGLNYARTDISEKLSFNPINLQDTVLSRLLTEASQELNTTAEMIGRDTPRELEQEYLEDSIPMLVRGEMQELGYRVPKSVVLKNFIPEGWLLRFGTAGFYFPFTAECYIDSGLHPIQKAFVAAHECAHGYGIGDEGTCNFIAYLACIRSDKLLVKYSAQFAYWRTIKAMAVNQHILKEKLLNDIALGDLKAVIEKMKKYPDVFPAARDFLYEHYLKLQGIKEGEANYDRFIELLVQYKNKQ